MWTLLKTAANDWLRHHDARLGAALAYYSVFSLGPLLLIVVSIAGLFFGEEAVRAALKAQFRSLLGPLGSQAIEAMLKGAGSPSSGTLTAAMGIILLLVAAVGVVAQLKDAINTIWETEEPEGAGIRWYVRTYLISFAGILGLGFLLAVSLVISTMLSAVSAWFGGLANRQFFHFAGRAHGALQHVLSVVSGRTGRMARCLARRSCHRPPLQCRKASHCLVHRQPRP